MLLDKIKIRGATEHNLKNVDLDIPHNKLVVITGLSGSGKSTLAFDTVYAEGQRKYMESLSAYARQFLDQMQKPQVESIEGLPPTIAIEQRSASHNPRSTVATTTEIYDYLRLLFARAGKPRCWHVDDDGKRCGHVIESQSATQIVDEILRLPEDTKLMLVSPVIRGKKGHHKEIFSGLVKQGFVRARVDGEVMDLREITQSAKGTPFTTQTQRYQKHTIEAVVDRIVVRKDKPSEDGEVDSLRSRVVDSVELALKASGGLVIVSKQDNTSSSGGGGWSDTLYSEHYACPRHPEHSLEDLEPRLFSFNSPYGACSSCHGLGVIQEFDEDLVVANPELSLTEGAIEAWRQSGTQMRIYYSRMLKKFAKAFGVPMDVPFKKLSKKVQRIILRGTNERDEKEFGKHFEGVIPNLDRRMASTDSDWVKQKLAAYLGDRPCPACSGARLQPAALHVLLEAPAELTDAAPTFYLKDFTSLDEGSDRLPKPTACFNINDVAKMTIKQAAAFFGALELDKEKTQIAAPIRKEVNARLGFMQSVGLDYLNLNRGTGTLSGGEAQRIRLATQVGSGLVGCCYVLDEPTIGLHQRDNHRLIETLRHLTDIGNTVVVVEHDEDTILAADYLIDIGPGPGVHGGEVVTHGTLKQVKKHRRSLTAKYLRGDLMVPLPEERRVLNHKKAIKVVEASANNLKTIDAEFPTGGLVVVTGVSGSGKSTLVNQVLLKAVKKAVNGTRIKPGAHKKVMNAKQIERIIEVDQSPIGRTPRSNPATYTGLFDSIRNLFTKTKEARIRGYKPGRFSFNVKGGRCESCQGQGTKKIEMHFLPDVFVQCDVCKGKRYNRETLEVTYRGKHIADVLNMTIEEALEFFDAFADIKRMLTALVDVGLSYVRLGQASTTLSGGEAQRVKLATELGKRSTGHTLYVLDEPTTGLHFDDVRKLVAVLQQLADGGNTMIIIEHNLDVIKNADWILDLGPEGGEDGGLIVASGTPEDVAQTPGSYTGQFLQPLLIEHDAPEPACV